MAQLVPTTYMAADNNGALELFVVAPTAADGYNPFGGAVGGLWHQAQQPLLSNTWSFPSPVTLASGLNVTADRQPTVIYDPNNQLLNVFVTDGTSQWQTRQDSDFTKWTKLGSPGLSMGQPVVGINADGRLEVFATGVDKPGNPSQLWHTWQDTAGDDNSWRSVQTGKWDYMGPSAGCKGTPALTQYPDGGLAVFVIDGNNRVQTRWQWPRSMGFGWFDWMDFLGSPGTLQVQSIVVAQNEDTTPNLFAICVEGESYSVFYRHQPFFWDVWTPLGIASAMGPNVKELSGPVVASDAAGRLVVIVGDIEGDQLFYTWQETPNDSDNWLSPWQALPSPPLAGGVNALLPTTSAAQVDGQTGLVAWSPAGGAFAQYYASHDANPKDLWSPWAQLPG